MFPRCFCILSFLPGLNGSNSLFSRCWHISHTGKQIALVTNTKRCPYLPIMVECCWTAASRRRSRMVHSPMAGYWRHSLNSTRCLDAPHTSSGSTRLALPFSLFGVEKQQEEMKREGVGPTMKSSGWTASEVPWWQSMWWKREPNQASPHIDLGCLYNFLLFYSQASR